ncbi:uncharacterized protein MKZ38_002049 [Zalerion maritima]|uniref:Uncharacterized protein n=1 Tax=Zalerion maritima TaxID=339359 RepID=A0AAD5WWW3_9PEZI|nr:uncharacterized protein MKZ38_002049 [Zalerion maritima]
MPATNAPIHDIVGQKGVKFQIKVGKNRYECRLQDKSTLERARTQRGNSSSTVDSASTSSSSSSAASTTSH